MLFSKTLRGVLAQEQGQRKDGGCLGEAEGDVASFSKPRKVKLLL